MAIVKGIVAAAVAIIIISLLIVPAGDMFKDDPPNVLDVLIIDGQSNAEYGGLGECNPAVLNEEYNAIPQHNVLFYGTPTAPSNNWDWSVKWHYSWAQYHLHNAYDMSNHQWKIGGYEPILGNTLSTESGHDILVVNMAIGARTIAQLLPDGADGVYSWGVLDHALEQAGRDYDAFNMIGVVWIQGESDKDTPVNDYKASFVELMDSFDNYDLDQFYIVHTRDYYGGNANIAQEELAEEYSNVQIVTDITETFTVENGMLNPDAPIHYSQSGRDAIAFDIVDKIIVPEYDPGDGSNIYTIIVSVIIVLFLVAILLRFITYQRD